MSYQIWCSPPLSPQPWIPIVARGIQRFESPDNCTIAHIQIERKNWALAQYCTQRCSTYIWFSSLAMRVEGVSNDLNAAHTTHYSAITTLRCVVGFDRSDTHKHTAQWWYWMNTCSRSDVGYVFSILRYAMCCLPRKEVNLNGICRAPNELRRIYHIHTNTHTHTRICAMPG